MVALLATVSIAATACGSSSAAPDPSAREQGDGTSGDHLLEGEVRLGYFPNVTHAPALVGLAEGIYEEALGDGVTLTTRTFNAGGEVIEALLSGALDISYIGPNPAINGFARSRGEVLRVIAGATSGGASFITTPDITTVQDLVGRRISTPALGNTQDVALRAWLLDNGLETTVEGGGEVLIQPQANAEILESFVEGLIDGAWVPEPWATRLLLEGNGHVFVDEADLWPGGDFVTTHVIVSTRFLQERPDLVEAFLVGHIAAVERAASDPQEIAQIVADGIGTITGTNPDPDVIATAFGNLTFTVDPIADSLRGSAEAAIAVGLLDPVDLDGIYDLGILNRLLAAAGRPEVSS